MDALSMAMSVIGILSLAVAGFFTVRSKVVRDTIGQYKELAESQDKRIKSLEQQGIENVRAIASLEGQLRTYKEIPLQQIAVSLKNLENRLAVAA